MPKPLLKILKWGGIALGVLVGLVVILIGVLYFLGGAQYNKTYDIQVAAVTVPTDEESIARGRHLVVTTGLCQECHGDNLEGEVMIDEPLFARLVTSNLTPGKGGIGGRFSDVDFVRAIRHGVRPDGTPLVIMPSEHYNKINDDDLGAIVSYIKSLPPVDNELPETSPRLLARLFILLGAPFLSVKEIDHNAPRPAAIEPSVTKEYGEYFALICAACHMDNFGGGPLEQAEAGDPEAPNISPSGEIGTWSEEDFIKTMRTGVTPRGNQLDKEFMQWDHFGQMTDDELKAIWLYLKSLPPVTKE